MSLRGEWIHSRDEIETFVPKGKTNLVILGTMGSIAARTLNGERADEIFFYHSPYNHFWRIMQKMSDPAQEPVKMTVAQKKEFLNRHGIAIANLVDGFKVPVHEARDPSDTLLFRAHRQGQLQFKTVDEDFKKILQTTPLVFTCKEKKGIRDLLEGYWQHNELAENGWTQICYLPTPTRCVPEERAREWKKTLRERAPNLKF